MGQTMNYKKEPEVDKGRLVTTAVALQPAVVQMRVIQGIAYSNSIENKTTKELPHCSSKVARKE